MPTKIPVDSNLFQHFLERQVHVGKRAKTTVPHTPQSFARGRVSRKVLAHWNGIDEEANESFQLHTGAIPHSRADHNISLIAVTTQQHLEAGENPHKSGCIQTSRYSPYTISHRRRYLEGYLFPAELMDCRTRPVDRHLQKRGSA